MKRTQISLQELETRVPAIFASAPRSDVSKEYSFYPTIKIVEMFQKENWLPVEAGQVNKEPDKKIYAEHYIRFAKPGLIYEKNEIVPEIYLRNSHDRSCRLFISLGLYRVVCSNGLITNFADLFQLSQIHISITFGDIRRIIEEAITRFELVNEKIENYRNIKLSENEKIDFAKKALSLRQAENVPPDAVLVPRRMQDMGNDLFTVFNVLQENLIKGGVNYIDPKTSKPTRLYAINEIRKSFSINYNLWLLMEAIAISKL